MNHGTGEPGLPKGPPPDPDNMPKDQQDRVTAAMEQAGSRATEDRPLAWIALEANRTVHKHELRVRYWPGGDDEVMLARAHAHGASIEWFGA